MSRAERELKAFLEEMDRRAPEQIRFNTNDFVEAWNKENEIKTTVKAYEAAEAAKKAHLEKIRTNPIEASNSLHQAFEKSKNDGSLQKWMEGIDKHCKESIRREQAALQMPKKRSASYEHFEDLYDIDHTKLLEAKAERTKATLIDDHEKVEALNKEIKTIEERISFYEEQMKILTDEEK